MTDDNDIFRRGFIMGYLCCMRRRRQGRSRVLSEDTGDLSNFSAGFSHGYRDCYPRAFPRRMASVYWTMLSETGYTRLPVLWSHLRIHYYLAFASVFIATLYALSGDPTLTILWVLSAASSIDGIVLRWNAITALKQARAARGLFGAVLADL